MERKIKILVVDDDPGVLDMTSLYLNKRGFDVDKATNGVQALEKLKAARPDVIITDVLMPEMDGYTFYKELKKNPLLADIPVLIITARGKMEDSFKVMGVDGFITKPLLPDALVDEIQHVITLDETRKETSGQATAHGKGKKILLIGAERSIMDNMAYQASRAGCETESAYSGSDAIAKSVKAGPDMIFIDVQLPDMPAGEVIDILRRLPHFADKPIIGYSYYATEDLDNPLVRRKVLQINEASKAIIQCGATLYIGRYNHQLFIKTVREYLVRGKS